MKKLNKFITFEGGEGVGKTTIINLLSKKLNEINVEHLKTREPGGNGQEFSEMIREVIMQNGDISVLTEFLLFSASRNEHMEKLIVPHLKKGGLVICDRFTDSSYVYQGLVKKLSLEVIDFLNQEINGKWGPSLTFIFDLDPKIGFSRIKNNNRKTNRFDEEDLKFAESIRKGFKSLAKLNNDKYIIIDASKNPEEITTQIINVLKTKKII